MEKMQEERALKLQKREKQKLMRELHRIEEGINKLKQMEESDDDGGETGSHRSGESASCPAALPPEDAKKITAADLQIGGSGVPDAIDPLEIKSHISKLSLRSGEAIADTVTEKEAPTDKVVELEKESQQHVKDAMAERSISPSASASSSVAPSDKAIVDGGIPFIEQGAEQKSTKSSDSPKTPESDKDSEQVDVSREHHAGPATLQLHGEASQHSSSCGASSKSSSDEQVLIEEAEVAEGEVAFKVDIWEIAAKPGRLVDADSRADPERKDASAVDDHSTTSPTTSVFGVVQSSEADPLIGSASEKLAEDVCLVENVEASEISTETGKPTIRGGHSVNRDAGHDSRMVNMTKPEVKTNVAEEIISEVMEDLLKDSLQVAQNASVAMGAEPALRHPAPALPLQSVIAEMWTEEAPASPHPFHPQNIALLEINDGADSEGKTPPAPRRTPPENFGEEPPSDAKSASSSGSDDSLGQHLAPKASPVKGDERLPFSSLTSGGEKAAPQIAPKDAAPPRPPSPPPDMRSAAATGTDGTVEPRVFRGRDEAAAVITEDLMQMLLGEVWQELRPAAETPAAGRRGAGVQRERPSKPKDLEDRAVRPKRHKYQQDTSDLSLSSSGGIDTSESLVEPFVAALLQELGVTDEDSPVQMPLPPVESWLPHVLEVMRSREGLAHKEAASQDAHGDQQVSRSSDAPRAAEASQSETPVSPTRRRGALSEDASREQDVASWTRLLAEALIEIAGEEVKAEPRVLGWRRPGYGESPLSRFKAQQVAEGRAARPQQTWRKVKARLAEVVRLGCRPDGLEAVSGNPITGGGALDSDLQHFGPTFGDSVGKIDEGIDQLLEEEICADEASWLDIGGDVIQVKNQVVQMIFHDLIEETVLEIHKIWSDP
jgi:hypothetical protein